MDLKNYVMEKLLELHLKNYKEYNLYDYDFLLKGFHFNKEKFSHQKFYKIHLIWNGRFVETKVEKLFPYSNFTTEYGSEPLDLIIDLRSEVEKEKNRDIS